MVKEDVRVVMNPNDDAVEIGGEGIDDDKQPQIYASIPAEHKAKKRL